MEYVEDVNIFKSRYAFRIIIYILTFLMVSFPVALSYYIFKELIFIPIIMTVLVLLLLIYFLFFYVIAFKNTKLKTLKIDNNTIRYGDDEIKLSDINDLSVYEFRKSIYKIKVNTRIKKYTIYMLNNGGLNIVIKNILEVKNG
ncbi:MAG: hypothetical protein K6G38_04680 [Gammaproteobacteria bacterium]|nr:hypothetical protein [Gammaproteobacteria bacterium]